MIESNLPPKKRLKFKTGAYGQENKIPETNDLMNKNSTRSQIGEKIKPSVIRHTSCPHHCVGFLVKIKEDRDPAKGKHIKKNKSL